MDANGDGTLNLTEFIELSFGVTQKMFACLDCSKMSRALMK